MSAHTNPGPSDNVFLGNIPSEYTQEQVAAIMQQYGTVTTVKVLPSKTGGPKGSALVRFSSVDEASWIVQNLNGNMPPTLQNAVARFANPPGSGKDSWGGGKGGGWGGDSWGGKGSWGGGDSWGERDQSNAVWIGELPVGITKEQAQAIFSQYATVSACTVLPPKMPGKKAAAILTVASPEEVQWLCQNLNGNLAEGLPDPIMVKPKGTGGASYGKASEKGGADRFSPYGGGKSKGKGKGKGGGGKGGVSAYQMQGAARKSGLLGEHVVASECQVYVKGLPHDMTELELYQIFAPFGPIAHSGCTTMCHPDGNCKGFGFVDYRTPEAAQAAIAALNNYQGPDGNPLLLSMKVPNPNKPRPETGAAAAGKGGAFPLVPGAVAAAGAGADVAAAGGKGAEVEAAWAQLAAMTGMF